MQKIVTVRDATITIPKTKTPAAICVFIISFTSSSRFPESLARVTKICTLETYLCYQWRLFLSCSWSPRRCTAARIPRCRRPSCEICKQIQQFFLRHVQYPWNCNFNKKYCDLSFSKMLKEHYALAPTQIYFEKCDCVFFVTYTWSRAKFWFTFRTDELHLC
jgi:hypothetical protein